MKNEGFGFPWLLVLEFSFRTLRTPDFWWRSKHRAWPAHFQRRHGVFTDFGAAVKSNTGLGCIHRYIYNRSCGGDHIYIYTYIYV